MIGSFIFLNPPSRAKKTGGSKMAYRRRRTRGGSTTKGKIRRTSRRAYTGLKRRRRRNAGTRKGMTRRRTRRAYMKTAAPRRKRRRRNPLYRTARGRYTKRKTARRLSRKSGNWKNNSRRRVRYPHYRGRRPGTGPGSHGCPRYSHQSDFGRHQPADSGRRDATPRAGRLAGVLRCQSNHSQAGGADIPPPPDDIRRRACLRSTGQGTGAPRRAGQDHRRADRFRAG